VPIDKIFKNNNTYIVFSITIVGVAVCNLHKQRRVFNVVCHGTWHVSVDTVAWNVLLHIAFRLICNGSR